MYAVTDVVCVCIYQYSESTVQTLGKVLLNNGSQTCTVAGKMYVQTLEGIEENVLAELVAL